MRGCVMVVWAVFQLVVGSGLARADDHPAKVGEMALSVPTPQGFIESSAVSRELWNLGERMTPPTNRLLAYFLSDSDIESVRSGGGASMRRYFVVQTVRSMESQQTSIADFAQVKDELRRRRKA